MLEMDIDKENDNSFIEDLILVYRQMFTQEHFVNKVKYWINN